MIPAIIGTSARSPAPDSATGFARRSTPSPRSSAKDGSTRGSSIRPRDDGPRDPRGDRGRRLRHLPHLQPGHRGPYRDARDGAAHGGGAAAAGGGPGAPPPPPSLR